MSNTRRHVHPLWNPRHPNWPFGFMTPKFQARDRPPFPKTQRFSKLCRNSRYNLLGKNDALRLQEAFTE